jgi:hypothetical protein
MDRGGTDPADDELRTALTRLVKQLVHDDSTAERRGEDLLPVLDAHFGVAAHELPVVVEPIMVHRWVDMDIALEEIVASDPGARLLGVGGGDQRHHSSLSDLISNAPWGRFRSGQVDVCARWDRVSACWRVNGVARLARRHLPASLDHLISPDATPPCSWLASKAEIDASRPHRRRPTSQTEQRLPSSATECSH